LIKQYTKLAIESAKNGLSGVIGQDEDDGNSLSCISFDRIKGGKPFNVKNSSEFRTHLREIGQV
jgi:pyrophosphate--fructose-6-phosphate 1-phosphotransferase